MKLSELFSCCLPVPRKKRKNERVDTSKKKQRKEAKRLKKEMMDRRRKEDLEMEISMEQSVEMVETSLDEEKDETAGRKEGGSVVMAMDEGKDGPSKITEAEGKAVVTIHHAEKVCDQSVSELDQDFSKEDSSKYHVSQMAK